MSQARRVAFGTALRQALAAGRGILDHGGTSVDAVVAAVSVLEDSPLFNAGRGAAFTADATIELDAAVMDGATRKAGAVALDPHGNLAAATSTGGYTNKLAGRVGDSPMIGAGTYASNSSAAVSCTGEGEHFMRGVLAHTVAMLMELKGWNVGRAARHVVHGMLAPRGGSGGLIALDRAGRVAMPFNSPGMYCGVIRATGTPAMWIYDGVEPPR